MRIHITPHPPCRLRWVRSPTSTCGARGSRRPPRGTARCAPPARPATSRGCGAAPAWPSCRRSPPVTSGQLPCLGADTIPNLPGYPSSQARVSPGLRTGWSPGTSLMACPSGYLASRAPGSPANSRLLWRSRTMPPAVPSRGPVPATGDAVPSRRRSLPASSAPPRTPGSGPASGATGAIARVPGFSSTDTTRRGPPAPRPPRAAGCRRRRSGTRAAGRRRAPRASPPRSRGRAARGSGAPGRGAGRPRGGSTTPWTSSRARARGAPRGRPRPPRARRAPTAPASRRGAPARTAPGTRGPPPTRGRRRLSTRACRCGPRRRAPPPRRPRGTSARRAPPCRRSPPASGLSPRGRGRRHPQRHAGPARPPRLLGPGPRHEPGRLPAALREPRGLRCPWHASLPVNVSSP